MPLARRAIKLHDAQASADDGKTLYLDGRADSVLVQILDPGTGGTLTFKGSQDDNAFIDVRALNLNLVAETFVLSATAAGLFRIDARGLLAIKVPLSGITAGAATVLAFVTGRAIE